MASQHLYKVSTKAFQPIRARVYVQDPLVARRGSVGLTTLELPGEPWLGAGPMSSRIEVVDRDVDGRRVAAPVRPLARGGGFAVGRGDPSKSLAHHQVNVWAIASRTLDILEDARVLGRRIPWAFPGGRLVIHPHAGVDENAYYDRDSGALWFFHFEGERGRIDTCLSHDVVTHELGHAVLDGLKPLYNELDSPDVAGFHEYFGDALAMVSSLTMTEVLKDVVKSRPARLGAHTLVSQLALEFGSRGTGHQPLRSASNTRTLASLRRNFEEHDFSEVLTGTFYDVLCTLYADAVPRMQETRGRAKIDGQIAMAALISAANRTSRLLLRAIDYCPPAGLTYAEYARAVLRADEVAYPVDERGYRELVRRAFVRRGVLRGRADARPLDALANDQLRDYDIDRLAATRTDAYVFLDANRERLGIPRATNFEVWRLYRTRKVSAGRYFPPREIVLEYGWPQEILLRGRSFGPLAGERLPLWCGGTLVFDSDGNVLHHVLRDAAPERIERFRRYLRYLVERGDFDADSEQARFRLTDLGGGRLRAVPRASMRHAGRT